MWDVARLEIADLGMFYDFTVVNHLVLFKILL